MGFFICVKFMINIVYLQCSTQIDSCSKASKFRLRELSPRLMLTLSHCHSSRATIPILHHLLHFFLLLTHICILLFVRVNWNRGTRWDCTFIRYSNDILPFSSRSKTSSIDLDLDRWIKDRENARRYPRKKTKCVLGFMIEFLRNNKEISLWSSIK